MSKPTTPGPAISSQQFQIPVCVSWGGSNRLVSALIDSGSAGNFLSRTVATELNLPLVLCSTELRIKAIDGQPIGSGAVTHHTVSVQLRVGALHQETLPFLVIDSPDLQVVLGYPWLRNHNPSIAWDQGEITAWGKDCFNRCFTLPCHTTQVESPAHLEPTAVPPVYQDLSEVFNKARAIVLPPHRLGDCAIELLPGTTPPRGRVYPLSIPESEAMDSYIKEALAQGFICPSTSPAAASFFFVENKGGGLRPCIDYRSLNRVAIKNRYPLPLVPSALEQLRHARVFTKLDLRSAYNLVRIRKGDEWKSAFITSSWHYEYLVMPYGLANAPSVFQAFVNDTLRDFLNRFVIVYIDDILVYSSCLQEHVQHVRTVLSCLLRNDLVVKAEKCEFHRSEVAFLGYIVSEKGITMDRCHRVASARLC